jgi:hypothetical protein
VIEIDAHLAASLSRRFRLVRRLGQGGMGAVLCRAEPRSARASVARPYTPLLTVLSRKLLDDPALQ